MTEKEKKAIEYLEDSVKSTVIHKEQLNIIKNLIQRQQRENKKKDKIIEKMAEYIVQDIRCIRPEIECNKMTHDCRECVEQYFKDRIESEDKQ